MSHSTPTNAQTEAAVLAFRRTYLDISRNAGPMGRIYDAAFAHLRNRFLAVPDFAERAAEAERAESTLRALAALPEYHRAALTAAAEARSRGTLSAHEITRQTAAGEAAAWGSNPLLAELRGDMDRAAVDLQKAQEEANAILAAQHAAAAPRAVRDRLTRRGVVLASDASGQHITVPPGTRLSDAERAAITEHKAGLLALLTGEADAARPVIVA